MREILFRSKEIDTGKWAYGNYYYEAKNQNTPHYITWNGKDALGDFGDRHHPVNNVIVEPETIGQYTGLTDKNGAKIFEGDIVGCFCNTQIFQVKWCDVRGGYFLDNVVMCGGSEPASECLGNLVDTIEVIGNIHDNPELLEKVEE